MAGLLNPELLSPSEGVTIVLGRLESLRRSVKRARIRQWMLRQSAYTLRSPAVVDQHLPDLPPPRAVLSRLNRSHVMPELVLPKPPKARTVASAISVVNQLHRAGQPPSYLLDALTATGLKWEVASALLSRATGIALSESEVKAVAQARCFWVLFSEGRARHEALVSLGAAKRFQGDWAYFNSRELDALLPGIILPDHCQRKEYFGRYVYSEVPRLDLYSASYKPLCQHRFEPLCRPLVRASSSQSNSKNSPRTTPGQT